MLRPGDPVGPAGGEAQAFALGDVEVGLVLRELGIKPDCVAGHSFGEVTALFAAGAIESDGLVRVARRRGELMRDAASVPGAMTAVSAARAFMVSSVSRALLSRLQGAAA